MSRSRWAWAGAGLGVAGVTAALVALAVGQSRRDDQIYAHVTDALSRLEQTPRRPDLDRVAEWEARYNTVRQRPAATLEDVRLQADAIRSLTERATGDLFRGSADAYLLEAEAQVEFEHLKECASRLGLPADFVPSSRHALLDPATLRGLEADWKRAGDVLRERATVAPGLYDLALTEITEELAKIRGAQAESRGGQADRWKAAIRAAKPPAAFVDWLKLEAAGKAAKVDAREGQLLEEALARNRLDYPAQLRALERQLGSAEARSPGAVRTELRMRNTLAMIRVDGYRPPAGVTDPVEFFKARYRDPLAAIQAEAKLRLGHPRGGSVGLPVLLKWMVGHMTDAQVFEARAYAEAATDLLREFTRHAPAEFQATVKVDLQQAQEEARLLAETADERKSRPVATPEQITWQGEFWNPKAAQSPGTRQYRSATWYALEVYSARTHPDAGAQVLRETLIVQDLIDHVAELDKAGKQINAARERAHKYFGTPGKVPATQILPNLEGFTGFNGQDGKPSTLSEVDLDGPARDIATQNTRVLNSLQKLHNTSVEPQLLRELQDRVRANLASLPPPGPGTGTPDLVSPYSDALIERVAHETSWLDLRCEVAAQQTLQWREEQRVAREQAWGAEKAKLAEMMRSIERYHAEQAKWAAERSTRRPRPR